MKKTLLTILTCVVLFACISFFISEKRNTQAVHTVSSKKIPEVTIPATLTAVLTDATRTRTSCIELGNFYWSIGNADETLVHGTVGYQVSRDTELTIASASKIVYAAYVLEKNGGVISDDTVSKLNLTSGYTSDPLCLPLDTPATCFARADNNLSDPTTVGMFHYGPGHMLALEAEDPNLQNKKRDGLSEEITKTLGFSITYQNPKFAGAGNTAPREYEKFLMKLVRGDYMLFDFLGTHSVCTNKIHCPETVSRSAIPDNESWRYSLGHWIETDPVFGDESFSSPGIFGFYPWIDKSKTYWGIIAREDHDIRDAAIESVRCGRELRKIFFEELERLKL